MAAAKQQLEGFSNVLGLIQGLQGKGATQTTKTSGSQTTKSDMTQQGMDRVLQQILAGPGGVKDISGAARGAGLYNSSAELMLNNDLAARAAGELEKLRAGTTTNTDQTQTSTIQQPGISLGGLIGPIAMMTAAKPIMGGISSMLDGKGFMEGTGLKGLFEGSASKAATSNLSNIATASKSAPLALNLGATIGGNSLDFINGASNIVGGSAIDLGATLGSASDFIATTPSFALNAVPGAGSFLSGLLKGNGPEGMGGFDLMSSAGAGAMAGGPVGALAGVAMSVLGSALGDASVVCTALVGRGLLDKEVYKQSHAYLQTLSPHTINGYHFLFTGIANKILAGNKFWTRVCLPFAKQRTDLIVSTGWTRWIRYPLGTVTRIVGQPLCWIVGKALDSHIKLFATE